MRLGGFGLIGLALLASVQGGRHQTATGAMRTLFNEIIWSWRVINM